MRLFISVLLLVSVGLTHAQTTVTCFSSADSVYNSIKELEEIVVTAEKRELNPKDIPAALTVITPRNIPGENNPDLRNLSGIVPNFYMQEGGLKLSTPIYIRGIGTVSGTPPVGLYVDGIPVFDKNAFVFDLYDIRQIEILRGPQTTLYGRNSICRKGSGNSLLLCCRQKKISAGSFARANGESDCNSGHCNLHIPLLPVRKKPVSGDWY